VEAKTTVEHQLVEQVERDLIKDYEASDQDAAHRARKIVKMLVGQRYGAWKRRASDSGGG
jgi:hypothetical protein